MLKKGEKSLRIEELTIGLTGNLSEDIAILRPGLAFSFKVICHCQNPTW
jgi:hypothetical protein